MKGEIIQSNSKSDTKTFRVVISKETEGGFMANIPSLSHCFSFGETIDEALENLHEALEGVIETMEENGWEIPDDSKNMEVFISIKTKPKPLEFA